MKTNKIYIAVSLLAMLAVLLPARSMFANAEEDGSSRDRVKSSEVVTGTLKQGNQGNDGEKSATRTFKRENDDEENDGEKSATRTFKRENEEDDGEENEAESHRSAVASFVKSLLEVADKNKGGIGEEVRAVAKEEDEAKDKVAQAVEEVKSRSGFKTFLIGTDFKNIGMIRSELAKTRNRIDKLDRLLETMTTSTGAVATAEQIQNLTQAQTKLADFIKRNEDKFSLFGWFVKLFNK